MYKLPIILNSPLPISQEDVNMLVIPKITNSEVAIVFDNFLRDELTFNLIKSIFACQPGYKLYIAEQGVYHPAKEALYQKLTKAGYEVIYCGFDAGISVCRNRAIKQVKEPFIFMCDCDNLFIPKTNLKELVRIFKNNQQLGYLGTLEIYNNKINHYENDLDIKNRKVIYIDKSKEISQSSEDFVLCDMTMNQGMIKKELFDKVKYDERMKLAEHLDFFLQIKYNSTLKCGIAPKIFLSNQDYQFKNNCYTIYRNRNKLFWKYYIEKWNVNYINDWKIENGDTNLEYSWTEESNINNQIKTKISTVDSKSLTPPTLKSCLEKIKHSDIHFVLIKDTCLDADMFNAPKTNLSKLYLGVNNDKDKQYLIHMLTKEENELVELTISNIRSVKHRMFLGVDCFVPLPVNEYLSSYYNMPYHKLVEYIKNKYGEQK